MAADRPREELRVPADVDRVVEVHRRLPVDPEDPCDSRATST